MSIDTSKAPKGWYSCATREDDGTTYLDGERCWRGGVKVVHAEAHRIAREEAQPYVTEALERIAAWLEEKSREYAQRGVVNLSDGFDVASSYVRGFASGARPLPGGGT